MVTVIMKAVILTAEASSLTIGSQTLNGIRIADGLCQSIMTMTNGSAHQRY